MGEERRLVGRCWVREHQRTVLMCVGLTGHQCGYILESSFGEAWCPKPGAKQTFPLPPGSSERFHPAREPRSGGAEGRRRKRMVTAGRYLHHLHQVSITLSKGQCPSALLPRRGRSSRLDLFHPHPSLLHRTLSHPDPFLTISSSSTASGHTSFTWGSSPAPSSGRTHYKRATGARYLAMITGERYTLYKTVLPPDT